MKVISCFRWLAAGTLVGLIVTGTAFPAEAGEKKPRRDFKPYIEVIDVDCPNCGWNTVELRSNGLPSGKPVVPFRKGETCPICEGRGRLMARIDWQHGFYLVEGFGVPPEDLVREYVETKSKSTYRKMVVRSARMAQVDCYRNAVRLAARVRLDGDRVLAEMAEVLHGSAKMWEEIGDGQWVDKNVSTPFFKKMMRVPLWGAEGVVGVFYKTQKARLLEAKKKKKPFDWRKALKDYEEHPEAWEQPGGAPPDTPGTKPRPQPGETPGETPEPEPGEVEPPPTEPAEEEPAEYDEIIIDARLVVQGGTQVNPALFPQVQFTDKDGTPQAVFDLSELSEETVSESGMVQYVNSNTPFEKISRLAGPRTLVFRASAIGKGTIRVAGLNLPILFQEGVDFTGKKGKLKKRYRYKFKAVKAAGLQKANIMISARDAMELKKTDEAAKILSKCKVIIISGGDIAGKEGTAPLDRRFARK